MNLLPESRKMKQMLNVILCTILIALPSPLVVRPAEETIQTFEKPQSITLAEWAGRTTSGVSSVEVSDYAPGGYQGELKPSPPHADMNAKKAVVVFWKAYTYRFIFSHEASYCPFLELSDGSAMCNQFFEGNLGDAELFNNPGRKERNSYVDIVENGPKRVWIHWNYFCVNMNDDGHPRLQGKEDYFAYPNGLILRRTTYESLMPDQVIGYSTQPVELFGIAPVGATLKDMFVADEEQNDFRVLTVLDLYSDSRYDVYWDEAGKVRRQGDDATLTALSRSNGFALVLPFRECLLFAVLGKAGGFPPEKNQLIDHCSSGAEGGAGWGAGRWDHWPIGWLNSQTSHWKQGSAYPYSFGSIGHFFVPEGRRIKSFWADYSDLCKDMDHNRWTARQVFHVLLGAANHWDEIRQIGRKWLSQGEGCARPESIEGLR